MLSPVSESTPWEVWEPWDCWHLWKNVMFVLGAPVGYDLSALQPEQGLLPAAFGENFPRQVDADGEWLHVGPLGWRVEKENLHEVDAVAVNQ